MSCCSALPFMLALSCRAGARHCNPESTLAAPNLNDPFICEKPPTCVKLQIHRYHYHAIGQLSWLLHAVASQTSTNASIPKKAVIFGMSDLKSEAIYSSSYLLIHIQQAKC